MMKQPIKKWRPNWYVQKLFMGFIIVATFTNVVEGEAEGPRYIVSPFYARGYRERSLSADQIISIRASVAEGLSQLNFKTLYDARIEIEDSKYRIELTGLEALVKSNEVVVTGKAEVKLSLVKSEVAFKLRSRLPEDVVKYDLTARKLVSPAATVELKGKTYEGRGLSVDLDRHEITWVQNVIDEKGKAQKTPLTLKYR